MKLKLQCKSERKTVAKVIGELTNQAVVYAKTPTYAYDVGVWHIDKQGVITVNFTDEISNTLSILKEHITEDISFVIDECQKPISNRIRNILQVKGTLIEKAIGSKIVLQIEDTYCEINFKFDEDNFDFIYSVGTFFTKLAELAEKLKYVSAKEKTVENERYVFRCFLLRLGFIGDEYKLARQQLLKNLTGNTAFKNKEEIVK